jgi:hypothetical protein
LIDRMTRLLHIERSDSFKPAGGGYELLRASGRRTNPATLFERF